eukprot:4758586-Prymnesium_polylepis.1
MEEGGWGVCVCGGGIGHESYKLEKPTVSPGHGGRQPEEAVDDCSACGAAREPAAGGRQR